MVGVAVKVTELPAQTGLADAAIDTKTGYEKLTVVLIVLEVAGLPVLQVRLDVRAQLIVFDMPGA